MDRMGWRGDQNVRFFPDAGALDGLMKRQSREIVKIIQFHSTLSRPLVYDDLLAVEER